MVDTPTGPPANDGGEEPVTGRHGNRMADVRASLRVDTEQLNRLRQGLDDVRSAANRLRREMAGLADEAERAARATGDVSSGGTSGSNQFTGNARFQNTSQQSTRVGASNAPTAGGGGAGAAGGGGGGRIGFGPYEQGFEAGGGGAFGKALGAKTAADAIVNAIKPLVQAMDNRIQTQMQRATSVDRMNVLMQQMYGMNQLDVMQNVRGPLRNYRLGQTGITDMLQFQTQTGFQATEQLAQSIEGIRTATGFSKTTADILAEQRQMLSPEVATRMFYMGGASPYNLGGGMKDPLQVRQEIIQNMGLTNEQTLQGALAPGSITRARLADLGLGEEMQTEILQYAQQNIEFQKKGGQGFYNPGLKEDRERMGVEENYATQQEETARTQAARDEQFMTRQLDNFAQFEKNQQTMIKLLGGIEDRLSAVVGARASTSPITRALGSAGGLASTAGFGLLAAGPPQAKAVGAGLLAVGSLMNLVSGDGSGTEADTGNSASVPPTDGAFKNGVSNPNMSADEQIKVPYGYGNQKISLKELQNKTNFNQMHSSFRQRLLNMMRANPNVGFGGGMRDQKAQEQMFRERYVETDEDTGLKWNGKFWKRVRGAPAAPPGRSMHEIGLAADLVGDLDWVVANANRFGLKHFNDVNGEPWHVQPAELPNSRFKYEQAGAPWGTAGNYNIEEAALSEAKDPSSDGRAGSGMAIPFSEHGGGSLSTAISDQASLQDILDEHLSSGEQKLGQSGGESAQSSGTYSAPRTPIPIPRGANQLTGEQVAQAAYNAGFRGDDLVSVVAIAKRESSWQATAYNGNSKTGDKSYGLMQINMIDSLGPYRRQLFGITSNADLYDPQTNMHAAKKLYDFRGGSLYDWGAYKGEANTYNTNLGEAAQVVKDAGLYSSGDPMPMERSSSAAPTKGGSSTVNYTGGANITVAPTINFNGQPQTPDLQNIAQTVTDMIKEEMAMAGLRSA